MHTTFATFEGAKSRAAHAIDVVDSLNTSAYQHWSHKQKGAQHRVRPSNKLAIEYEWIGL
jgi:hypothetical protein